MNENIFLNSDIVNRKAEYFLKLMDAWQKSMHFCLPPASRNYLNFYLVFKVLDYIQRAYLYYFLLIFELFLKKQPSEVFCKNFIIEKLQHWCFPVKCAKYLKIPILENICERLLLLLSSKEKNLDPRVFRLSTLPIFTLHKNELRWCRTWDLFGP